MDLKQASKLWHGQVWSRPFVRFLIFGVGNTAFGYMLYLTGLGLGLSYQAALIGSTVLGAIFNFFTTGPMVFENHTPSRIFGFLAVYGIALAVNLAQFKAGVGEAHAQAVSLPAIVILSFLLNKHLVFGRVS